MRAAARAISLVRRCVLALTGAWWLIGCVFAATAGVAARADDADLARLRARIAEVEARLAQTREERDDVREQLREVERDIGRTADESRNLRAQLAAADRTRAGVEREQQRRRGELRAHERQWRRYVRAAYMSGGGEFSTLKFLLHQDDPAVLQRMWVYHRYVARARSNNLQALRDAVQALNAGHAQWLARTAELRALNAEHAQKQQVLRQLQARRQAVLRELNRRVEGHSTRLARLHRDEQRLRRLVDDVERTVASVPFPQGRGLRFGDFKGRLPLPATGRIEARYGTPRQGTDLKWQGIFLAAPAGAEVKAVFPGRVAYADWLRGFGLLLILEHGDGYMSLYGHGQSLYKKVGEWVAAGEVVGSAGQTGGFPRPGVYFEIRHRGEPRNPLEWARR